MQGHRLRADIEMNLDRHAAESIGEYVAQHQLECSGAGADIVQASMQKFHGGDAGGRLLQHVRRCWILDVTPCQPERGGDELHVVADAMPEFAKQILLCLYRGL